MLKLVKRSILKKKIVIDNNKIYIGTNKYSIELTEVQMEGKKNVS